ncbi:ABC transporter permease [Halobacteriales archaeon QH_7_68_42]|nr:MAG: ABC transporter permease [Halobacteriales archaeon QH_7_68_42]
MADTTDTDTGTTDPPGPDVGPAPDRPTSTVLPTGSPVLVWVGLGVLLFLPEAGAFLDFVVGLLADGAAAAPAPGAVASARASVVAALETVEGAAESIPTLLSRETIPNQGHWNGERWVDTFFGLSPAVSWGIRAALVYVYAFAWAGWAILGYRLYRRELRAVAWTPRDDMVDRLRTHTWGKFGLLVVFMFVVMAVFAPALGPTTVEENMRNSYSYEMQYWDGDAEEVRTTLVGDANLGSQSTGSNSRVMPMTYDEYGRFHPFGTLPTGRDLFTFIVAGSRISLIIGVLSVGLSALMAALYSGAFVLALIFAFTGWTYMWRSLRGPALQVSERQWVDAARSFGQRPRTVMRKHMLPYITGYLLIYGSMTLGGAIIAIAGLSFLGLGVSPPTPEWGRAINLGQDYVTTGSWHISLVPGLLITVVVTGFNALGDGIRDAIDPQSDSAGGAAGRGGGA